MNLKIGIISDIHNNVVALNVILKHFKELRCDLIVCAGDIIGIGPSPEETVQRLKILGEELVVVRGNHEHYLTNGMNDSSMSQQEFMYHKWEHEKLSEDSKMYLNTLVDEVVLHINGYRILVCHYAMIDGVYKDLKKQPSSDELETLFDMKDFDIVIYGHDHKPSYLTSSSIFINPGSLGCPGKDKNIARAGLLDLSYGISYKQLNMEYDISDVLHKIEHYHYPAKDEILRIFYGLNPRGE